MISEACNGLGVGSSNDGVSREPRMVGLAGPGGAGKSTVASMVIARREVRASFHNGLIWLQVGQGAKDRLPALMLDLAEMVYKTVMKKTCRPPKKASVEVKTDRGAAHTAGVGIDSEDGAAYVWEVVGESNRHCVLVVADDVWEEEVLEELKRAGLSVLYTTRQDYLLFEAPLRVDQMMNDEARMVLRRAAELDDNTRLPDAADDLIKLCKFGVMYLAFVGRWGDVRGRSDRKAWQAVLDKITEAQKGSEGAQPVSWRAAVLRAGLEELAGENLLNRDLYLALAVIPKGLAFPSKVAGVLLHGHDCSIEDLENATGVATTLERLSILRLESSGKYRVHDEHATFLRNCRVFSTQEKHDKVLLRWRAYIGSIEAVITYSSFWLARIWATFKKVAGNVDVSRPYDAALEAMEPSSAHRASVLGRAARFHWRRQEWSEAFSKNLEVLAIEEDRFGDDSLTVATTLYSLGACAWNMGQADEAEEMYRRSLTILENKPDAALDVANTLHSLGTCTLTMGRIDEAEGFFRRALAIRDEMLGEGHLEVAQTLHLLGMCLCSVERVEEAEELLRRALHIWERHPEATGLTTLLSSLGQCASKMGRMEEAENFFQRERATKEHVMRRSVSSESEGVAPVTLHDASNSVQKKTFELAAPTEETREFHEPALAIRDEKVRTRTPYAAQ